jgi:hypothetical protein
MLLGRILASENKLPEAREVFNGVLRDFPNDAAAKTPKLLLRRLTDR